MDYLRMALEQASTAFEAMNIIIENTQHFGQGGDGGYEHPLFYHNSYLLVDPKEAYVLETVGKYYAFKKLEGSYNMVLSFWHTMISRLSVLPLLLIISKTFTVPLPGLRLLIRKSE